MNFLPSTQSHLDIVDIKDDLVILKGGKFRIVIEATAINFDLLSEDEQNATIYAYATLVNSLDYPLQVLIRTRQVDITNYINYLKSKLKEQPTAALKEQMEDYIEFIQQLVVENTVLQKSFFVVIPWDTIAIIKESSASLLPFKKKNKPQVKFSEQAFKKAKNELHQRFEELTWQFKRLGIQIKKLKTEELIRLYYTIYNPEAGENQGLKEDAFGYTTGIVKNTLKG